MLKYTIIVALSVAETEEIYTTFKQEVYDSFNSAEFENVIEMFNELVAFTQSNYDTEETYELSAYILDGNDIAIY
jgi:hypothetical protein